MIAGTTRFELTSESHDNDYRVLRAMSAVPPGTRVILHVGSRSFADPSVISLLREYVDILHFDVHGEPAAVKHWVTVLRDDDPSRWTA